MRLHPVCKVLWGLVFFSATCSVGQTGKRSEPLKVSFCDLYQDPQKFAGKMVEVHAVLYGHRDPTLDEAAAHEPCSSYMRIGLEFPQSVTPRPDFDLERDDSFQRFEQSWHKGMRVIATFEGRFDPVFTWRDHVRVRVGEGEGFGREHLDDGRIVLYRVSDVKALHVPGK